MTFVYLWSIMYAQLSIPACCRAAYNLLQCNPDMTLLSALREASDYNIDIYKEAILYLARKLSIMNAEDHVRWPIYALDIASWETSQERSPEDIKGLLCI